MPTTWYARPVFISSTFKDMHAERDWLQRYVFPRLEEKLLERHHHLEPIDLRLGVETGEAGTVEDRELLVLKVCLDEIRRSRPYMLVFLGDRYGWVPPLERLEAAAREQEFNADLPGKSVTALEIEFGIFNEDPGQKQRSLFFFRRPLPYETMAPEVAAEYCDACSPDPYVRGGHDKLDALKERLRRDVTLGPRVFDYSAAWDDESQRVTGLEAFGELVFEHLWAALEEETSEHLEQPSATWQDEERAMLAEFCEHRARNFVGRQNLVEKLLELACRPDGDGNNWGTCVIGLAGTGKSALFAKLYDRLVDKDHVVVLANAAGSTLRGSQVNSLLLRWSGELADHLNIENPLAENPTPDDLDATLLSLVHRTSANCRVVLLMDALDQFEPSTRGQHLTWLKGNQWPANARVIATALPGTSAEALCRWAGVEALDLPALTEAEAIEVGRQVWQRYHRELSPQVLGALTAKRLPDGTPAVGNPLWLILALEQLNLLDADDFIRAERDFTGSPTERIYSLIMDTANRMPPNIEGLYGWLLTQVEKAFGSEYTRAFAVAIALSRFGWREQDLLDLIPCLAPLLVPKAQAHELDGLKLAALRRGFRAHLIRRGEASRLDYSHAQMRLAIRRAYLGDEGLLRKLHGRISGYLETLIPNNVMIPIDRVDDFLETVTPNDEMIRIERMRHLIGERDRLRTARCYFWHDTSESSAQDERTGSSWTLVKWIAEGEIVAKESDDSTANQNLRWVGSWLDLEALSQDEVYHLANNFQYDLLAKLENEVGLSSQCFLIEQTRNALKRLAASDPSNMKWQTSLSVSHIKIGVVLRAQGDLIGALKAFRESLAVRERVVASDPSNTRWQFELGMNHSRIGMVLRDQGDLAGALKAFRESLAIAERLTGSDLSNTVWQGGLSASRLMIGEVLYIQGNQAGALKAYRESLAINERLAASDPSNVGWQRDLSANRLKIGDALNAQGDLTGALKAYRESLAIAERLAASDPSNVGWQRDLSVRHNMTGVVLYTQGDLTGALKAYRESLAIAERLAVSDPNNADWQFDLVVNHTRIGEVLLVQGDLTGALKAFRESLVIAERLTVSDPSNAGREFDLSTSQLKIGDVLNAQGDLAGALKAFQESLAVRKRLVASDPSNLGWQFELAVNHSRIGMVLRAQGDLAGALKAFRESLEIRERIWVIDSSNMVWQNGLLKCKVTIGDILRAQGDLVGALKAFRESLPVFERLAASDPSNADWQHGLSASQDTIGKVLRAQGDLAGALKAFRESLAIFEQLAASEPFNTIWQSGLIASLDSIGEILYTQGDLAGALKTIRQSLAIDERLAASDPSNADWQRGLARCKLIIGEILRAQGDLAEALKSYLESLPVFERLAASDPSNADWQQGLLVAYNRIIEIHQKTNSKEVIIWWQKAYNQLFNMKKRGFYLSPQDENNLQYLRQKIAHSDRSNITSLEEQERIDFNAEYFSNENEPIPTVDIPTPNAGVDPRITSQLNIKFQKDLTNWKALPWWKRLIVKKPAPPTKL